MLFASLRDIVEECAPKQNVLVFLTKAFRSLICSSEVHHDHGMEIAVASLHEFVQLVPDYLSELFLTRLKDLLVNERV
eukprot:CAMPEP_0168331220 /NCGR_PEP_ID=MMETSP0213-20121227/8200_1 /TAXON_ID=151035 /ORGANISM="Euplotes harpa, Strain FSP1.4" /LENGTH=77 /DNA_ID=CAMNT_0008334947 /DNA_START=564 /DNA_END=797 /DNA_ORIENTATION=-